MTEMTVSVPVGTSSTEVIDHDGTVTFKLHGFVDVDAHDLFTGVSSGIEQRHVGTRVEIG